MAVLTPKERAEQSRSSQELANRENQSIYKDWREEDVHTFLQEAFEGSGGFSGSVAKIIDAKSYLVPNPTENFYITRNRISAYNNYYKKYINAKYKPIYKGVLHTSIYVNDMPIEDHLYYDFVNNITGSGVNKQQFSEIALRSAYIHDLSFVVMDKKPDEVLPYVYLMTVQDVEEFSTDEKGALIGIWFDDGLEETATGDKVKKRRYIGLDQWHTEYGGVGDWKVDADSVVRNTLGFLPVYALFTQRPDDLKDYKIQEPSTKGIAALNWWVYDKSSKLDYLIDKQAHAIFVMQGHVMSMPNGVDNGLLIAESERSIFDPKYLSPDTGLPKVHSDRIDQQMGFMFDLMAESGVQVIDKQDSTPESGVSKSYDFIATNNTLKYTITLLVELDKWLESSFRAFTGDNGMWSASTEYPDDFMPRVSMTPESLTDLYEFYNTNNMYEQAKDTLVKLRSVIDPMATKADSQLILEEIESGVKALD